MTHDLDLEQFAALRDALPADRFDALLDAQIADVTARLNRMIGLFDFPAQLEREAHDLISSAGNFGMTRLSRTARAIVTAIRAGQDPADLLMTLPGVTEAAFAAVAAARRMRAAP